jgi:L-amino acid N-acyltransferase YncA
MASDEVEIVDITSDNLPDYGVCGYKNLKREGHLEKVNWLRARFAEGLRLKILSTKSDGTQGMIEYIPGQNAWRPVHAHGYMFIHCIFSGFKRAYKRKGYGSQLLNEVVKDARAEQMAGVAVVTRQGPFMAGRELFLKHGFHVVDNYPPNFELLATKFDPNTPNPTFKTDINDQLTDYRDGLTIIRADQCPYTVKNVREIIESAQTLYGLKPRIINLSSAKEAQNSPCAFGTFCIIYNGEILTHHPISNTRFKNIMNKVMS